MIDPRARLRGLFHRWTAPLLFRSVGKRTLFFGRVRMPVPFRNVTIGDDCMIGDCAVFQTGAGSRIVIGSRCSVNTGCHIVASQDITIGDNVAIAEYVSIRDQEHKFSTATGVHGTGYVVAPVTIKSNVWIGRGVYIGPGTVIESGSIVGANSVVRGTFPRGVHIAGSPARIVRYLDEESS